MINESKGTQLSGLVDFALRKVHLGVDAIDVPKNIHGPAAAARKKHHRRELGGDYNARHNPHRDLRGNINKRNTRYLAQKHGVVVLKLIDKHVTNIGAMAHDRDLNPMRLTEPELLAVIRRIRWSQKISDKKQIEV